MDSGARLERIFLAILNPVGAAAVDIGAIGRAAAQKAAIGATAQSHHAEGSQKHNAEGENLHSLILLVSVGTLGPNPLPVQIEDNPAQLVL